MQGIFISYRQSDSKAWAALLREELGDLFGHERIFLDRDTLTAGSWRQQIDAALGQCGVALIVIGPGWLDARGEDGQRRLDDPADVHRHEVALTLQRSGLTVIPVLVDDTPMPAAARLPDDLRELSERQARPLSSMKARREVDLQVLAGDIQRATGMLPREAGAAAGNAATGLAESTRVHHLPWKVDEAAARAAFQRWAQGLLMAPGDFAAKAELGALERAWVPYWVAEGTVTALWRGRRGTTREQPQNGTDDKGQPVQRTVKVTDWAPVEGDLRERFEPVVIGAAAPAAVARPVQLDAAGRALVVDAAVLPVADVAVRPLALDRAAAHAKVMDRLHDKTRESVKKKIGGDAQEVVQLDLRTESLRLRQVLVPVFEGSCRYGGKAHAVVIGACSGAVEGDAPVSGRKIGIAVAIGVVVVAAIVLAFIALS